MAYSDAITLPLISTEVLDAFSVGSEYTRVEKTLIVGNITHSYAALDVCVNPSLSINGNCSVCWKCRRTLLTFEIAGIIDKYKHVFDLKAYNQKTRRKEFIADAINSKDPLLKEIIIYAKHQDYKFSTSSRFLAKFRTLTYLLKSLKYLIANKFKEFMRIF